MKQFFIFLLFSLPILSHSQITAREEALQKEYYNTIVEETNEAAQKYIKEGQLYRLDSPSYYLAQSILDNLCIAHNTKCFPFYITKEVTEAAAMYPNGILVMNERVVNSLNRSELTFILAHEFAHYYYKHSIKKSYFFAKTIVDNGIYILDVERVVKATFLLPGMKETHYLIEQEADDFAIEYLKYKNISIDCEAFFNKIIDKDKLSLDQHKSSSDRCSHFKE